MGTPIVVKAFLIFSGFAFVFAGDADNAKPRSHAEGQSARAKRSRLPEDELAKTHRVATGPAMLANYCANGIYPLCDPSLNPAAAAMKKSSESFDRLRREVEQSPEVVEFIRSRHGSGKIGVTASQRRFALGAKDYGEYVQLVNEKITEKMFTPRRKEIANEYFSDAQRAMVKILEKRKSLLVKLGEKDKAELVDVLIKNINTAELIFGTAPNNLSREKMGVNAEAQTERSEEGSIESQKIYLEGSVMWAEDSPESLLMLMLHELGHLFGPRLFRELGMKDPGDFIFDREIVCLTRSDTAGVGPDQDDETFSDYIATEAYAEITPLADPNHYLDGVMRALTAYCNIWPNTKVMQPQYIDSDRRANWVFFANPKIKRGFGCPEEYIRQVTSLDSPDAPSKHGYCGPALYDADLAKAAKGGTS